MSVKKSFLFLFFVIYTAVALAEQPAGSLYQVDISTLQQAKYSHTFLMGKNLNPSGDVIQINKFQLPIIQRKTADSRHGRNSFFTCERNGVEERTT